MAQSAAEPSWEGSRGAGDEAALRIPARHVAQRCNVSSCLEKPPEIRVAKKALVSSDKLKHVYFRGAEEYFLGIVL